MKSRIKLFVLFIVLVFSKLLLGQGEVYDEMSLDPDSVKLSRYVVFVNETTYNPDDLQYIREGLQCAQRLNDLKNQMLFTYHLGRFYHEMNISDEAISYYLQALSMSKITKDTLRLINTYNQLAAIYIDNQMLKKAEQFNNRALDLIGLDTCSKLTGSGFEVKARIYFEKEQWYQSLEYAQKAQEYYQHANDATGVLRQILQIAKVYERNHLYEKASNILIEAEKSLDEEEDKRLAVEVFYELSGIMENEGSTAIALQYLENGLAIAQQSGFLFPQEKLLLRKANIYEGLGKKNQAIETYHSFLELEDTLEKRKAAQELQRLEVKYRTEQQKQKNQKLKEELARYKYTRDVLIGITVSLLLSAMLFLVIRRYRHQKKKSIDLQIFNKELEKRVREATKELEQEIHVRKLKTEEAEKAKLKAEESDRLKSEFLKNISHEVRTPMNRIIGYSDLLVEEAIGEEERSHALIIKNDSERLLKIIVDIIELSKLATDDVQLEYSEVDLMEFFEELEQGFFSRQSSKVDYVVEVAANCAGCRMHTDLVRMKILFRHLLDNAFKFTTEGQVKVMAKKIEQGYHFSVSDTGEGIDPLKMEYIFDYFRQGDGSDTRNHGGLGAGLALVKQITDVLGGQVTVESEKERGTTFFLVFPQ